MYIYIGRRCCAFGIFSRPLPQPSGFRIMNPGNGFQISDFPASAFGVQNFGLPCFRVWGAGFRISLNLDFEGLNFGFPWFSAWGSGSRISLVRRFHLTQTYFKVVLQKSGPHKFVNLFLMPTDVPCSKRSPPNSSRTTVGP